MTDTLARLATALADRYRIEQEFGTGGMVTVYLAISDTIGTLHSKFSTPSWRSR